MKLKKELSLLTATLYGVGIILGAGIYVLIGKAAGIAGNAMWISFAVAAFIAALTGLSYAELSGRFPKDAAEYVYTKKAFRKSWLSFIVQWVMIFTLIVSATTVALGFGSYFFHMTGVPIEIAAAGLLIVLSAISFIGIKESSEYNVVGTLIESSGLLLVILIGVLFVLFLGKGNVDYFSSAGAGVGGILSATALIFFAYIGFEELVNMSEETKNARKVMPRALVLSIAISTLLYMLVSISAVTVLGADALAKSPAPLSDVVSKVIPQGGFLMSIIALFATSNTVLAILVVVSRMLYGLSCNNTLPRVCSTLGKRQTPYVSIFIVMLLSLAFLLIGNLQTVALLTDVGIFLVYIFVNAALIKLRFSEPRANKQAFRSPINIGKVPLLAALGIASSVLMLSIMLSEFGPLLLIYEAIVVLVGLLFYGIFTELPQLEKRERKYAKLFRKNMAAHRKRI